MLIKKGIIRDAIKKILHPFASETLLSTPAVSEESEPIEIEEFVPAKKTASKKKARKRNVKR